ncbi:MAG: two-component system response regulator [Neptuniibacter caesariensis]|uniref:Two-component system response regulator n=1 Tax=Neptuniibacter caesariensis TaxID=207954 RepID=A0A2G6JP34_NEPCE|nr:MAG: two-component system response regulator [Neptuniibacter caesariensis]
MKKILVVEDDPVQQKHICTVLASCGVQVVIADNGKQGLEKAKSEKPDLIFMDIVMPEMDGYSACRQITTDAETKHIPVVIVSSKNEEADKVWGQLQGASAMVAKPFTQADLQAQIDALT